MGDQAPQAHKGDIRKLSLEQLCENYDHQYMGNGEAASFTGSVSQEGLRAL